MINGSQITGWEIRSLEISNFPPDFSIFLRIPLIPDIYTTDPGIRDF
jgi:hypothetical protein